MLRTLWIASFILLLSACRQEPTRWDVDVAVPIARGTLAVSDYDGPALQADVDGLLHLILDETFTGLDLAELAVIPDTTLIRTFESPIPIAITLDPGQEFLSLNESVVFDAQGAELDEVHASGGTLSYSLKNYVGGIIDVNYALPGITLNGEPVVLNATLPAQEGETPGVAIGAIDLAGHILDLTGESGFEHNTLFTELEVIISEANAEAVQVSGLDSISVWMEFLAPEVSYARGYFGQQTLDLDESLGIEGGLQGAGLMLEQVDLQLDLKNFVGIDGQLQLNNLNAVNSETTLSTPLDAEELSGTINITRAHDYDGWVDPTEYSFIINSDNSNVNAFMGAVPDSLNLTGTFQVNPLGNVSGHNDFLYTEQTFETRLRADIPLCISTSGLTFTDTLDITNSSTADAYGELWIRATNRSTLGAELTLQLLDENGQVLTDLGETTVMQPGVYDGFATQPAVSELVFDIPDGASLQFIEPHRLRVTATLFTENGEPAKVYEDALIDLVVTARATATLQTQ